MNGNFKIHNDFKYYNKNIIGLGGTISYFYSHFFIIFNWFSIIYAVLNEIFILEKLKGIKQIPSLLDYECSGEKVLI